MLKGKRTYVIAFGIVLTAVGSWFAGDINLQEAVITILAGLGLGTLRASVDTTEK
jgi:hypothetical protein